MARGELRSAPPGSPCGLELTARLLAVLMPGVEVVRRPAELRLGLGGGRIPPSSPRGGFLEDDADLRPPAAHLEATTDSIAARGGRPPGAPRLTLLKRAPHPPVTDPRLGRPARALDPLFPTARGGLGCVGPTATPRSIGSHHVATAVNQRAAPSPPAQWPSSATLR
jgi:hypothetical protein